MAKATLEVKLIFFLIYDVLTSLDKQQISAVDELSILLTPIPVQIPIPILPF